MAIVVSLAGRRAGKTAAMLEAEVKHTERQVLHALAEFYQVSVYGTGHHAALARMDRALAQYDDACRRAHQAGAVVELDATAQAALADFAPGGAGV